MCFQLTTSAFGDNISINHSTSSANQYIENECMKSLANQLEFKNESELIKKETAEAILEYEYAVADRESNSLRRSANINNTSENELDKRLNKNRKKRIRNFSIIATVVTVVVVTIIGVTAKYFTGLKNTKETSNKIVSNERLTKCEIVE